MSAVAMLESLGYGKPKQTGWTRYEPMPGALMVRFESEPASPTLGKLGAFVLMSERTLEDAPVAVEMAADRMLAFLAGSE